MGAKDIKSKEYLADNARFADLCNYKLYDGEQVILPEDLQERDSTEILSILGLDDKEIQAQKWRDLLKSAVIKSTQSVFYVLIGVENQTDVHYTMPVRNMLYDALNYGKQVNEAKKKHEKNEDGMTYTEFLSGFKKDDKLTPIIPITLYWGTDEWDAPTHIHEMFGEIDKKLLEFIPDYRINLVAPNLIDDFDKFKTELGPTLEFIKYSNDKKKLENMLFDTKNQKLSNETVSTINLFTGSEIKLNKEGEVTNMCLAIEEMKKEAADEARAEMCLAIEEMKKEAADKARAEMCLAIEEMKKEAADKARAEMCLDAANTLICAVENVMDSFHVSLQIACESLKYTKEDYDNAKSLINNSIHK